MTLTRTLRNVPLFSQLRDTDLELLAQLLRPRDYVKNRVILSANDICDTFHVVLSGQVKVMLISEDGREVVLSLVREGDFFGETALLDDAPYTESVVAMEDSSALVLHREDFRRCIREMPDMAFGLLRALCDRLREADYRIGGLILLDVTGRVSHLLLELAARHGGSRIPEPPTHQVIAQMVGSSRETISRTMSVLVSQRLIDARDDGITILNREALATTAGQLLRRRAKTPPAVRRERRPSGPQPSVDDGRSTAS